MMDDLNNTVSAGHHGMMGSWMGHGAGGTLADVYGAVLWLALLALIIAATVWLINDITRKK